MGWDGAGNYSRQHNFSADASAGTKILALRVDQELDDVASAMTIALTRNGQNVPTGNLPMGGFRHINVGAPTSVNNYMRSREFIENIPIFMDDTASSADRISVSAQYFTSVSANQAPGDGTRILVRVLSDKSSAALYLNGHSANVEFQDGNRASESMVSGGIYEMLFSSVDAAWKITQPDDGRTAAERTAGVTPASLKYPELHVDRYGTNSVPGTTDMTLAIRAAISVAAAAGGGTIHFRPGTTYLLSTESTHSVVVPIAGANFTDDTQSYQYHILLDGLDRITFDLHGATVLSDVTNGGTMFLLDSCRNVCFQNGKIQSQTARDATGNATTSGMHVISATSQDRDAHGIRLINLEIADAFSAFYCFGTISSTYRVRGTVIEGVRIENGMYAVALHENGDGTTIDGFHASNVSRDWFFYGVDGVEWHITSDSGGAASNGFRPLIKAYRNNTTNLKGRYKTTKTVTSGSHVGFESEYDTDTQATPSKILNVSLDVDNSQGNVQAAVAFGVIEDGVTLSSTATQVFHGITLSGIHQNAPDIDTTQGEGTLNTDGVVLLSGAMYQVYDATGFVDPKERTNTYTPVLRIGGSTTGITYTTQQGQFYRRGRHVRGQVNIVLSSTGGLTGAVTVEIPITSSNPVSNSIIKALGESNVVGLSGPIVGYVQSTGDLIVLQQQGATGVTSLTEANLSNTSRIQLDFEYAI